MDSITKIFLKREDIEILVVDAFGPGSTVKDYNEMTQGWYNTIYSIQLHNDQEVILKIAPPANIKTLRYEQNIMNTEVSVLRLLKNTNIPVPTVYYYNETGKDLIPSHFFMEKISGDSYSNAKETLSTDKQMRIEKELGYYNRCINEIMGDKFGYYSQPDKNFDHWFDAFYCMFQDILLDGKEYEVKLPISYDELDTLLKHSSYAFESIKEPRLIHWDLHDGNVIVTQDGRINGIIDCDRALWGDPLIESYLNDYDKQSNFMEGYGELFYKDKHVAIRRHFYNIYLYLIMTIESYYRNYDDSHKKWTFDLLEKEINTLTK